MTINLLIADDHRMMIDGICAMLRDEPDFEVVATTSNGLETLQELEKKQVHVVLLDVNMPVMDGVETCKQIKKLHPLVKVLALTMYDEGGMIAAMIRNGAQGYVLKNTGKAKLLKAIREIYNGSTYFPDDIKEKLLIDMMGAKKSGSLPIPKLTRREKDIIRLIVEECTTQEIADRLFISVKTVESHRKNLLQKLNARNTAGLVRIAIENKLLD